MIQRFDGICYDLHICICCKLAEFNVKAYQLNYCTCSLLCLRSFKANFIHLVLICGGTVCTHLMNTIRFCL